LDVKKLVAGLESDKGYDAIDIGDKCQALYGELASLFTVSDAVSTYWALMHKYDRKLALNKTSGGCIDGQMLNQMKKLGLPTDDLDFLKPHAGAVAVSAVLGNALSTHKGGAEMVAARPRGGATYEYVPLAGIKAAR
jgi:hypothetical protein